MAFEDKVIFVYADWLNTPTLIGKLFSNINRGKETFSFEYSDKWLFSHAKKFVFDPDLSYYQGRQFLSTKPLFGVFTDSCPDHWGRLLMKRREAILAKKESRKIRTLTESDYILGVFDESRMGALRFSLEEGGTFLSSDNRLEVPPWIFLRELENASISFENNDDGKEEQWLNLLIAPGSSLGGARPKASVKSNDGSLWIAKFPSKNDEWDSGAWEMVVHKLAKICGLHLPEARLEKFSRFGSTFLVKRFDRKERRRIHFSSAMTLLGKTDGESGDTSYLDLASFIKGYGAFPKEDLTELWSRIVFYMAVSNTDDHLRNHGFLLCNQGWRLSPLYDVNPNLYNDRLSLNVSLHDNLLDFDLALEVSQYFDLSHTEAKDRLEFIKNTVNDNWQSIAKQCGLSRNDILFMEPAFVRCKT